MHYEQIRGKLDNKNREVAEKFHRYNSQAHFEEDLEDLKEMEFEEDRGHEEEELVVEDPDESNM